MQDEKIEILLTEEELAELMRDLADIIAEVDNDKAKHLSAK